MASLTKAITSVDRFNAKLHQEYGHTTPRNPSKLTVIFTMGLPASGKSTIVQQRYGGRPDYVIIDPDAIAARLPGYDPKAPQLVHEQASAIAEEAFHKALSAKSQNIVLDKTGTKSDKLIRRVEEARKAGYLVRMMFVTVPLEVSLARNRIRKRVVPEAVIIEKGAQIHKTFEAVKPHFDEVEVIDNTPSVARGAAVPTPVVANPAASNPNRPPKQWWDMMYKRIALEYPGRSKRSISRITAGVWYGYSAGVKAELTRHYEAEEKKMAKHKSNPSIARADTTPTQEDKLTGGSAIVRRNPNNNLLALTDTSGRNPQPKFRKGDKVVYQGHIAPELRGRMVIVHSQPKSKILRGKMVWIDTGEIGPSGTTIAMVNVSDLTASR